MKITLSVIKADIGGYVGHSSSHPDVLAKAQDCLSRAKDKGLLVDFCVTRCGDDLELIMTHKEGEDNEHIHKLAWDTFIECTWVAKQLKLHGAGQDLLSDAFSGNVKGMGPGTAEMQIDEREAETIIVLMADKTSSGAWNMPLYKMFADPFNTVGLVIASNMHGGFSFEIHDVKESKMIVLNAPEEIYDMLIFLGAPARYALKSVRHRDSGEIAAISSTQKLSLIAGRYVGKDDPVCIVRSQGKFPAVGEILEPFSLPHLVEGWMRGSHYGPLMPVAIEQSNPSRFDGPPRVVAAGFQLAEGKLVGPRDMFDDPAFDETRRQTQQIGEYLRRHGPFEPHRLPLDEMEYTTMPEVSKKLQNRFVDIE
ncbi:MAG: fructose-1,6-bisphosphate aldolase/phosphatase [Chloroflexota bacterium]|nr:fructose-1,6-bisphosphate aldolase/phosphatase [Chloroflexota bacterium]